MQKKPGTRILVGLDGGSDSMVAAALLKNQGYQVQVAHLQILTEKARPAVPGLSAREVDVEVLKKVCAKMDFPFRLIDGRDLFEEQVRDYTLHELLQNRMPVPSIRFNFGVMLPLLLAAARETGCEMVATGNYARIIEDPGTATYRLLKANDPLKDQSQELFKLSQAMLKKLLMPLGGLTASMTQRLKEELGLGGFVGMGAGQAHFHDGNAYKDFVDHHVSPGLHAKGVIRQLDGRVVGEHDGLYLYRIGQREGIPLAVKETEPLYVLGYEISSCALIVGSEDYLLNTEVTAADVSWIRPLDELHGIRCMARYDLETKREVPCRVTVFENSTVHVLFDQPQRAINPGQAIVFYQDEEVLGGGFVAQLGRSKDLQGGSFQEKARKK